MLKTLDPLDTAPLPLRVAPAPALARFTLRIDPASRSMAGQAFGVSLPERIGALSQEGDRRAVQLGPDEWVLYAPEAEGQALAGRFRSLAEPHSLVATGDRELAFLVEGARAATALMAACPLDLDAMAAGTATRTVFDKVAILLVKESGERFRVECWRSFAPHFLALLAVIERELAAGL